MKKYILIITCVLTTSFVFGQHSADYDGKVYKPAADASADIKKAIEKASEEGKHVLIQIGGNWCSWCIAFNKKVHSNDTLKNALESNFVAYHLNYSKENWNEDVMASLDYPQRFGFPVFVVLDGQGKRLHTQNSAYLEEGRGHSTKKVLRFFNHWSPKAVDPKSYPSRARK